MDREPSIHTIQYDAHGTQQYANCVDSFTVFRRVSNCRSFWSLWGRMSGHPLASLLDLNICHWAFLWQEWSDCLTQQKTLYNPKSGKSHCQRQAETIGTCTVDVQALVWATTVLKCKNSGLWEKELQSEISSNCTEQTAQTTNKHFHQGKEQH